MKRIIPMVVSLFLFSNTYAQLEWVKSVGGGDDDHVNALAYDNAGYVYHTGHISDDADMDPGAATYNLTYGSAFNDAEMYVAKYDTSGNLVWAFNTPGANSNSDGKAIAFDPTGYIYVLAEVGGGASGIGLVDWDPGSAVVTVDHNWNTNDAVLAKYDTSGNLIWAKLIVTKIGLTDVVYANGLVLDMAGNVYVAGQYSLTVDVDPSAATYNLTATGGRDIYICKYTSDGDLIWGKSIGGSGDDAAQGLFITPTDSIYLYGHFQGTSVDFDLGTGVTALSSVGTSLNGFYAKYDTAATLGMVQSLPGNSSIVDLKTDAMYNVICGGFFTGTIDVDPSAATQNIVSGGTHFDHFLVKYEQTGNLVFGHGFTSSAAGVKEEGNVQIDASGNIYFASNFSGTVDYSGGSSTGVLACTGSVSFVISKYTPAGAMVYAYQIGTAVEQMRDFMLLNNSLFIVGDFRGATNFDPCGGSTIINKSPYEIFMLKMGINGCITTDIEETTNKKANASIFPNPNNSGLLGIDVVGEYSVKIINLNGQLVKQIDQLQNNVTIDIKDITSGFYFVEIKGANYRTTQKLIVQ